MQTTKERTPETTIDQKPVSSERSVPTTTAGVSKLRVYRSLLIMTGLIFVSDQLTKWLVDSNMSLGQSVTIIPGMERLIQLTYITNTGAAFGLFQDSGLFFIVVAIAVSAAIIYYYPLANTWLVKISLGLQLGGALGNLWDRITNNGHVIDYMDIGFWPIFNIADISIVSGVTLLAIWLWQEEDRHKAQNGQTGQ